MRDGDDVLAAFDEQCDSADRSRELCDIFGFDAGGNHAARRDRLLSLLQGPPSRRRVGWMDLLLQAHDAGATGFDDLEPGDLEVEELDDDLEDGDNDVRLLPGSISLLLDLRDRLPVPCDTAPAFSTLPDLVREDVGERTRFSLPAPLAAPAVFSGATQVANPGDPQPQPADLEQRIRESIFRDIRDGKLVVPSDSTVASS